MKNKKIGIVGCGTIGRALAKAICSKFKDHAVLSFICDRSQEKAVSLKKGLRLSARISSMRETLQKSDLVIEAASAEAAAEILKFHFRPHQAVMVMSVGAILLNPDFIQRFQKKRMAIWIPSGAVAGIDGLKAAREGGLESVTLITRKPPAGIRGAAYFKKRKFPRLKGREEIRVFKGNALQAVKNFPQNINVAAVASLAGLGAMKTTVEIWTSNAYRFNQHEIRAAGKTGSIQTVVQNFPSAENPKTSALAIYSAIATLRKIFSSVQIGA